MNDWARCVLLRIMFGVVVILPAQLVSLADEPSKEPARPTTEVITAWEQAGAEFGWIKENLWGDRNWKSGSTEPAAGLLPAFRFKIASAEKLKALPPPEVRFGLRLQGPQVTDDALEELSAL